MMLHLGFVFYSDTFWRDQAQYTNQYTNRVYWICVLGLFRIKRVNRWRLIPCDCPFISHTTAASGNTKHDFSREVMGVKKFAHTGTSPEIETHRHYIVADGRKGTGDYAGAHTATTTSPPQKRIGGN